MPSHGRQMAVLIAAGVVLGIWWTQPQIRDPGPLAKPEPVAPKPRAGDRVKWTEFAAERVRNGKTPLHTDILSHLPAKYGNQYDVGDTLTSGHETTHGINAHLRNTLCQRGEVAFYVGGSKAALMPQPKITLAQIGAEVPANLRGSRYQLYFVQQQRDWNDTPLYCFDEWVAYTNEGGIALELKEQREHTDAAIGQMEFAVYACCALLAIEKHDPAYLRNEQFREYVAHELIRATTQWRAGQALPSFKWDSPLPAAARADAKLAAVLRGIYDDERLSPAVLFAKHHGLGRNVQ